MAAIEIPEYSPEQILEAVMMDQQLYQAAAHIAAHVEVARRRQREQEDDGGTD